MMLKAHKPLVVGLTGAIGAGKTTVAKLLLDKGVPVIDADALGREILETSERARAALRDTFGPSVFAADGRINRAELARVAFSSRDAVKRLNEAVHPALVERIINELASCQDVDVVAIDAALIVEWGAALPVDLTVVVEAPEDIRRERSRLKYGADDFNARQMSQLDVVRKRARADVIIDNAGSLAGLKKKVDRLYRVLLELAGGKAPANKPLII
jgi:dephospho-CoA kinase